jgi:hypothetical protein
MNAGQGLHRLLTASTASSLDLRHDFEAVSGSACHWSAIVE